MKIPFNDDINLSYKQIPQELIEKNFVDVSEQSFVRSKINPIHTGTAFYFT